MLPRYNDITAKGVNKFRVAADTSKPNMAGKKQEKSDNSST